MEIATRVYEEFPFFLPSPNLKEWNGIIVVEEKEVLVTIVVPNFPDIDEISLTCSINWEAKLHKKLETYRSLHVTKGNFLELLQYLREESSISYNSKIEDDRWGCVTLIHRYIRVLEELRQIGSEAIVGCSADISRITIHSTDRRGVDHQLVVVVPSNYPTAPATVMDADLPETALSQLSQERTLVEIMITFEKIIDSFQDFWLVYEELKNNTWIIDPEHPRLRDTHCRIVVGKNISMLVALNPQEITSCPDIQFLGPESLVSPFITSVEKHLKTKGWDENMGICDNLLTLLGLTQFPQPDKGAEANTMEGECSICFTVRSSDHVPLPVKVCNNDHCDSFFHVSCLAKWFQAVPTNEASFNLISGGCPSCGEKILCPMTLS